MRGKWPVIGTDCFAAVEPDRIEIRIRNVEKTRAVCERNMTSTKRLTLQDCPPGVTLRTRDVAAIFGVTKPTVVAWIKRGILRGSKIGLETDDGIYFVPSEEVRRLFVERFGPDPVAASTSLPTPSEERRQAEEALKRLDRMNKAAVKN